MLGWRHYKRLFMFTREVVNSEVASLSTQTSLKSSFFIGKKNIFVVNQRLESSHDTSQIPRWMLESDVYKKFHSAVFSLAFYYVCYASTGVPVLPYTSKNIVRGDDVERERERKGAKNRKSFLIRYHLSWENLAHTFLLFMHKHRENERENFRIWFEFKVS